MVATRTRTCASALADELCASGFGPYFGTPCGVLAPLYEQLSLNAGLTTVPREDNAIGMAAGAALAGAFPVVLMQNSGLGQSVNALASLVQPYQLSMLLVVSVRGVPPDATAENTLMGRLTEPILSGLGISSTWLEPTTDPEDLVAGIAKTVEARRETAALLVAPDAFGWNS